MLDISKYCTLAKDTKRTWVVPKWEHWDELIALLRLLGCREGGVGDDVFVHIRSRFAGIP